jgi:hypothetical protein
MTTSTAGLSFNSPPATERAGFEEHGGQIVDEYYGELKMTTQHQSA